MGTWLDRKGIYYLVDAFCMLIRRNLAVELTVAGCVSLEADVKVFFLPKLSPRVRVIPFVKREDMPAVYAERDLSFSRLLSRECRCPSFEAMAAGNTAVVTTNTSGMADVVEDGFNGLTVPTPDADSLVEAVERLCGSVELRKQLGQETAKIMRRYTWDRVTRQLEAVLSLASQQAARS